MLLKAVKVVRWRGAGSEEMAENDMQDWRCTSGAREVGGANAYLVEGVGGADVLVVWGKWGHRTALLL